MQKPESKLKEKVLGRLRDLPNTWAEKIQQATIRGTPDLLCCVNGSFIAIELKSSVGAKIDRLQEWKINQIRKAGGKAVVMHPDNMEEILTEIEALARKEAV